MFYNDNFRKLLNTAKPNQYLNIYQLKILKPKNKFFLEKRKEKDHASRNLNHFTHTILTYLDKFEHLLNAELICRNSSNSIPLITDLI